MLDVVEDPAAEDESPIADAWMAAVKVLGKLRATEALDVLVDHLDRTGQNGFLMSIHIRPVYSALVNMGEPAVPKLIEALAHPKRDVRMVAAWVLFSIRIKPKPPSNCPVRTRKMRKSSRGLNL